MRWETCTRSGTAAGESVRDDQPSKNLRVPAFVPEYRACPAITISSNRAVVFRGTCRLVIGAEVRSRSAAWERSYRWQDRRSTRRSAYHYVQSADSSQCVTVGHM